MELKDRVRERRIELGLTQEELAKRMGYSSRVSINKIEMGRPISQKIILRLSQALSCEPSYLLGIDNPKKNDFTSDEMQLIYNYRHLHTEQKQTINTLVDTLIKQNINSNKKE